jgi:hypothetical protein
LKKKRRIIIKDSQRQVDDTTISIPVIAGASSVGDSFNTSTTSNAPPPPSKTKENTPTSESAKVPDICNTPANTQPSSNISPPRMKEKTATENAYIQSLSKKEYKAYLIAKSHLMTSFSLKKSNGYLAYVSSLETSNTTS